MEEMFTDTLAGQERAPGTGASARPRVVLFGLGLLAMLVATACYAGPQTTVMPKSDAARMIQALYVIIFWASVVVFIGVQGGLLYMIWRFRARPGHELPEQVHGNTRLEILWTIIPAVILVVIAIPTFQTIFDLEVSPPPVAASSVGVMDIEVIAHQWWWEYRYPKEGIVTANEMVIPAGQTLEVTVISHDVIHSFWVPQLFGKQDVMPVRANTVWFTADEPGQYFGQCAEYCGLQHAQMRMNIIAMSRPDFDAWVARMTRPAEPTTELARRGAQVFAGKPCVACHTIQGTNANGKLAPNLSHFGSRTTMAAGIVPNTTENLTRWLQNPDSLKYGNHMAHPPERWGLNLNTAEYLNLRPQDVEALVEYLHSLK